MIEKPAKLTIRRTFARPSQQQVAAFQGVPTGFVVDALMGRGAFEKSIKPIDTAATSQIAGVAVTADNAPGDILATLGALNFIKEGDFLVAGASGYQGCAACGDRVAAMAKNCGAVGLVTDGPVRDLDGLLDVALPVWCAGLTPMTPFSNGPGRVGGIVQIAGQAVAAGDIIVADRDGVVVVPFDEIDQTISKLSEIKALEIELDDLVANGLKLPEAIAEMLESDQVKYLD